jgi:hypothetical protein
MPFDLPVDYGANGSALTERALALLRLPDPFARATRVEKTLIRPGVKPVLDATANAYTQSGDTITQYWGDFDPLFIDSIRIGMSLQPHVMIPNAFSSTTYSFDALIGRDMISQFDVEFDGPARAVRFYQRYAAPKDSAPPWLPRGLRAEDCTRAAVVGPRAMPRAEPSDTAGMSDDERRRTLEVIGAAQRMCFRVSCFAL